MRGPIPRAPSPLLAALDLADHRDEAHGEHAIALVPVVLPRDHPDVLGEGADGDHETAADLQLLEQGLRDARRGGRHEDRVEGSLRGLAAEAVPRADVHAVVAELREHLGRAGGEGATISMPQTSAPSSASTAAW